MSVFSIPSRWPLLGALRQSLHESLRQSLSKSSPSSPRGAWLVGIAVVLALHDAAAADYPTVLPNEALAQHALDQSPQMRIAHARLNIGAAQRRITEAGTSEWELSVVNDRLSDSGHDRYQEQQYSLSKRMRWPNKYLLDQRIGETTTEVAEYAFEDAWHEAGRSLLAGWFTCLRAQNEARLLGQQVLVLEAQLTAVTQRVQAGDAPALERAQAEAELARVRVSLSQAEQAARSAVLGLQQEFPDLSPPTTPTVLDEPVALQGSDEEWLQRIMGENHEIKLAEGEAKLSQMHAERAAQNRVPDPTIGLSYSDNKDGNKQLLGVGVTIPLGGSARRAEYAAARSSASIAEQHARAARLKVASDGRLDLLNVRNAYSQWQQLKAVSAQSQRNAELVQRGYSLGEFSYAELQAARRQALDSSSAAQNAQLTTLEAHARLQLDAHLLWAPDDAEETQR